MKNGVIELGLANGVTCQINTCFARGARGFPWALAASAFGRGREAMQGGRHISLAFTRGSITAYSTSTTKFTSTTMAASSSTQLRTTITSRLEMD